MGERARQWLAAGGHFDWVPSQPLRHGASLSIFHAEFGDPEAPLLALVHGFPTSSIDWFDIVDPLAAHYRVVVLDLPGFGFSDKPKGERYTLSRDAELVGHYLTEILGARSGAVVAHDRGDSVALSFADRCADGQTGFELTAERKARAARPCAVSPFDGKPQAVTVVEQQTSHDWGGAAALGTVSDYLRFGQMLHDGGVLEGQRILSPQIVALMTSDHLTGSMLNTITLTEPHREGYGFGLGVAVRTRPGVAAVPGRVGEFSWNGAYGTIFFTDPAEKLVVVAGTVAPGEIRKVYREQLQNLVYGAMTR
jgi:hypothetical protein